MAEKTNENATGGIAGRPAGSGTDAARPATGHGIASSGGFFPDIKERQDQERAGQEALAKRITPNNPLTDPTIEDARVTINSKLTTKEHLGNHPDEPDKPDEQEALKVGRPKEPQHFDTVEISTHESGEATDTVVVPPEGAAPAPHPALHVHDAIGTAAVIHEHLGSGKKGKNADGTERINIRTQPDIVGKGPSSEPQRPEPNDAHLHGGKREDDKREAKK